MLSPLLTVLIHLLPSFPSCSILQYDLSITTYTPDGKLMQLEYAQKAVDASGYVLTLALFMS